MAGSDFDFSSKDVSGSMKRLKEIKAENDRITKKINKKVMGMIEKAESEYAELSRKKEVRTYSLIDCLTDCLYIAPFFSTIMQYIYFLF